MDIQEYLKRNTSVTKCEVLSPKNSNNTKSVLHLDKNIVWNQFPSTFKLRTKRQVLGEPESSMLSTSNASTISWERTSARSRPYSGRRSSLILAPLNHLENVVANNVFTNQNEAKDNHGSTRPTSAVSVVSMGCHDSVKRSNHVQPRNSGFPARGFLKGYRHLDRNVGTPLPQEQEDSFDALFLPEKNHSAESDELDEIYNSLTEHVKLRSTTASPFERHFTTPLGHLPLNDVKMRSRGQRDHKSAATPNDYSAHLLSAAQERAALEAKQAKLRERQELNAVYVPKTKTRLLRIFTGSTVDNERMCRQRTKPIQFLHLQTPITIHTNQQANSHPIQKSFETVDNPPFMYSSNFFTSPTTMYHSPHVVNHRMHNCYRCRESRKNANIVNAASKVCA